jgi:L-ribulokinase
MDFGTDSVRCVIINAINGEEISSSVSYFKRWIKGNYCNPAINQFRQHPLDHIEAMEEAVKGALKGISKDISDKIVAIGADTTGSTPAPMDENGIVLSLKNEFKENPNAMFVMWKDHTAVLEAEEINRVAKTWGGTDFTKYVGGVYSSEWFWAKILYILRNDEKVREAAFSWVEHADWIPAILTGNTNPLTIKRSKCAAGHKAMWHNDWNGLPPEKFLVKIDALLQGLRKKLYSETHTPDKKAGLLSSEWAEKLGLNKRIVVAVGSLDAHVGAVGAGIKEKTLLKIIGTSCCDMAVVSKKVLSDKVVKGICGQVDDSIIPGMIGLEAGQSSFGDVYVWFKSILMWSVENILLKTRLINGKLSKKVVENLKNEIDRKILPGLEEEAIEIEPEDTGLLALDWLNGRRTPYADQKLKGAIAGLNLGTTAAKIFRSLVESTAFGAKVIIDKFKEDGIGIEEVVGIGGVSQKSPFVMQVLADVLDTPVKVAKSQQTIALGAAMFASVAVGIYSTVKDAQKNMGSGFIKTYYPDSKKVITYKKLYAKYKQLGLFLEDYLRNLG